MSRRERRSRALKRRGLLATTRIPSPNLPRQLVPARERGRREQQGRGEGGRAAREKGEPLDRGSPSLPNRGGPAAAWSRATAAGSSLPPPDRARRHRRSSPPTPDRARYRRIQDRRCRIEGAAPPCRGPSPRRPVLLLCFHVVDLLAPRSGGGNWVVGVRSGWGVARAACGRRKGGPERRRRGQGTGVGSRGRARRGGVADGWDGGEERDTRG
jgi:hypothetical protein